MTRDTQTIMDRLKWETRDLHTHTESRPLQRQIARGKVSCEDFAAYLGQLLFAHRALESALQRARSNHPAIPGLTDADRMRVPDLEKDLGFYGIDPATLAPGMAVSKFAEAIEALEETKPVALLGSLYVVEGSTNGGRFLARVLRKAWGLDGDGLRYFDPYGNDQPERWASFKRIMNETDFDTDEQDAILDAAHMTFSAIADVSEEVIG